MLLIGLSLLLYPTLSDYWNSFRQTRVVARYTQAVAQIEDDQYESLWADARRYNQTLVNNKKRYHMSDRQRAVSYTHLPAPLDRGRSPGPWGR